MSQSNTHAVYQQLFFFKYAHLVWKLPATNLFNTASELNRYQPLIWQMLLFLTLTGDISETCMLP